MHACIHRIQFTFTLTNMAMKQEDFQKELQQASKDMQSSDYVQKAKDAEKEKHNEHMREEARADAEYTRGGDKGVMEKAGDQISLAATKVKEGFVSMKDKVMGEKEKPKTGGECTTTRDTTTKCDT
jgi:hypothetical protein